MPSSGPVVCQLVSMIVFSFYKIVQKLLWRLVSDESLAHQHWLNNRIIVDEPVYENMCLRPCGGQYDGPMCCLRPGCHTDNMLT